MAMPDRTDVYAARGRKFGDVRFPELQIRTHFVERHGEKISLHLGRKNAPQIVECPAVTVNRDRKVPSRIVGRLEERESLDVIPVRMRKTDENIVVLFDAASGEIVSQFSNSRARVEDPDSSIFERHENARGITAESGIFRLSHRCRTPRTVKRDLHCHLSALGGSEP